MASIANYPAELDASTSKVTRSINLAAAPRIGSPEYMSCANTDHMVTVRWTVQGGWEAPEVKPYSDLSISPTASCLHYATECFEGLKAYRGYDGRLRLFRPDRNGERLMMSSARGSLPTFHYAQLKYLIEKLLEVDGPRWLPKEQPGRFLYIRPAMIGTGRVLGVKVPDEALLFIIATPYKDYATGQGLKLLASRSETTRAWPGGFGYAKLGANYGPSLAAHALAQSQGFDQVLWLFGKERQVTEAGASNIFIVWHDKESNKLQLVTPGLENQLILCGITRQSVLELARSRLSQQVGALKPLEVIERQFTINEVQEAWSEGRILEAFVTGTAFFITPVSVVRDGEVDISLVGKGHKHSAYSEQIKSWLESIMYGKEEHEWAYGIEG